MTIEEVGSLSPEATLTGDLAVIGAGPAGIVAALEAAKSGMKVLLIESGRLSYDARVQHLSDAASWETDRHAPMTFGVRRQIGGTSTIWGGRCVPYDPVDFAVRSFVGPSRWPVTYEELLPYFSTGL